jgi:hypothetical protein
MIYKIISFFRTAPRVKSDKVLLLERAGKMNLLIDAIEAEKKGLPQKGDIKVKKV